MKSATAYLLAARRCEIGELERLAATSALVGLVARLVHALQRERGLSNVYLASGRSRFAAAREEQLPQCDALEASAREGFDALAQHEATVRNGARLFNRMAVAVDALDALPALRARVGSGALSADEATAGYVRLIAALLAVVFEAADSAGDPEISRALVAMFHFMQGKEYAGQERAQGAAVFAAGRIDAAGRQRWRHLIDQQQHCLDVFREFAEAQVLAAEARCCEPGDLLRLEQFRRMALAPAGWDGDAQRVERWYECCTARLDGMRVVEELLELHLRSLCQRKIGEAADALRDQQASLDRLHAQAGAQDSAASTPALIGPQLERSVIDMVHEQARRLQAMADELETARAALHERKLIERAKGLLMAHRQLGEDEAYRALRQMAMNQKRRLVDVAQAVLAMADMLPGR